MRINIIEIELTSDEKSEIYPNISPEQAMRLKYEIADDLHLVSISPIKQFDKGADHFVNKSEVYKFARKD